MILVKLQQNQPNGFRGAIWVKLWTSDAQRTTYTRQSQQLTMSPSCLRDLKLTNILNQLTCATPLSFLMKLKITNMSGLLMGSRPHRCNITVKYILITNTVMKKKQRAIWSEHKNNTFSTQTGPTTDFPLWLHAGGSGLRLYDGAGLFVALWFIEAIGLMSCLVLFLFLCFSVLLALRLPRLEKTELVFVLFVLLFDLRLFGYVCVLFLLVSGRAAVCDCDTPWTFLLPFF